MLMHYTVLHASPYPGFFLSVPISRAPPFDPDFILRTPHFVSETRSFKLANAPLYSKSFPPFFLLLPISPFSNVFVLKCGFTIDDSLVLQLNYVLFSNELSCTFVLSLSKARFQFSRTQSLLYSSLHYFVDHSLYAIQAILFAWSPRSCRH